MYYKVFFLSIWKKKIYFDVVITAIGGSFNIKGEEIQFNGLTRIQSNNVNTLFTCRIRRWEIWWLDRAGWFRPCSSANCYYFIGKSGVSQVEENGWISSFTCFVTCTETTRCDAKVRAETHEELISLWKNWQGQIAVAITADQWALWCASFPDLPLTNLSTCSCTRTSWRQINFTST